MSLGGEATWGQRIIGVLYWAIAIAVTGSVIGFITSLIKQTMARLGKGQGPVVESCQSVIWYRSASAGKDDASKGVSLNPSKNTAFTAAAGNSLIVIASE